MEAAFDGTSRILWTMPNNGFMVWNTSASGSQVTTSAKFGPVVDANTGLSYVAKAIAVGSATGGEGVTRVLLVRSDGAAMVRSFDPSLSSYSDLPPAVVTGWTPADIDMDANNKTYLLWTRSDAAFAVWRIESVVGTTYNLTSTPLVGPLTGWNAVHLAIGNLTQPKVLLNRSDGGVAYWTFSSDLQTPTSSPLYGPYGAYTTTIAGGTGNGARLLWAAPSPTFSLWDVTDPATFNPYSAPNYGLPTNWTAKTLSVSGGKIRVLHTRSDGAAAIWTMTPGLAVESSTPLYGPLQPPPPTAVTANASNGTKQVVVDWENSATTGDPPKTYSVFRKIGNGSYSTTPVGTVNGDVTTYLDTSVNGGTTYSYKVQAFDSMGVVSSDDSTEGTVTTPSAPAVPTGLSATPGNGQVSLSWQPSARAVTYRLARATNAAGPYTPFPDMTDTSYTHTGLTNGTTYYYKVQGVNAWGTSSNSSAVSATPFFNPTPTPTPYPALPSPEYSEYQQCTDTPNKIQGKNVQIGKYGLFSIQTPVSSFGHPAASSHFVYIQFSCKSKVATDGQYYSVPIYAYLRLKSGTEANPILVCYATATEERYTFSTTVSDAYSSVDFFCDETNASGQPQALASLHEWRARYTPTETSFDCSPMAIDFTAPVQGAVITGWPGGSIGGTLGFNDTRANNVDHVCVGIHRDSDDQWWTGSAWQSSYIEFLAAHDNATWNTSQVPTGVNLPPGTYTLYASSHNMSDFYNYFCTERVIHVRVVAGGQNFMSRKVS